MSQGFKSVAFLSACRQDLAPQALKLAIINHSYASQFYLNTFFQMFQTETAHHQIISPNPSPWVACETTQNDDDIDRDHYPPVWVPQTKSLVIKKLRIMINATKVTTLKKDKSNKMFLHGEVTKVYRFIQTHAWLTIKEKPSA